MSTQPEQLLKHIAAIVHCGGVFFMSDAQALIWIRKLTLGDWDATGDREAMRARVVAAMRSTETEHEERQA
jgi:hypothetical protein